MNSVRSGLLGTVLSGLLFIGSLAGAASPFTNLRDDHSIPEACRQTEVRHFEPSALEFFTVGALDAERAGFDHEYPIERDHARRLWQILKGHPHRDSRAPDSIKSTPALVRDYEILVKNYEEMDFDFRSEGEILELLAIQQFYSGISREEFFITGSVSYGGDRVAGELDMVIGRKENCKVVAVGEVKLGRKSVGHARRQLERFRGFINRAAAILNALAPMEQIGLKTSW